MTNRLPITLIISGAVFMALTCHGRDSFALSPYEVKPKRAAILPFADYSNQRAFTDALKWAGARRVVADLTEALESREVEVIPQDDVINLLLEEKIIKPFKDVKYYGAPEYEIIHNVHEQAFTKGIFKKIAAKQEETIVLNREKIAQLGKKLGVDTIIRGAIFKYELKPQEMTDPFRGFIPFLMYQETEKVPCYASAASYEAEFYKPNRDIRLHDYGTEFPVTTDASTIIVEFYVQDSADGRLLWRDHIELKYPDPSFIPDLKRKTRAFAKTITAEPNYGFLFKAEPE